MSRKNRQPSPQSSTKSFRDGFSNVTAKLGISGNNQMSDGRYAYDNFLTRQRLQLDAAYRQSWIVGKTVDTIAEDMTRGGCELTCELKPDALKKIIRCERSTKLWERLCDSIKWSRLYGGAIGVILIDGQDMKTPLDPSTVGPGKFKGIYPLDRWQLNVNISQLVTEFGPNMGMPEFYDVLPSNTLALASRKIHYTRVVRFDGIKLPYWIKWTENLWGESCIERMHDRLLAFDSATQGAAQLVFKAHLRVVGVKNLREVLSLGGKAEEALIKQFEYIRLMQSNEGITLLDSEDEFNTHQYTFSGLADMILQFGQQISGAIGIPLVRLFGQSPVGLNATGESDLRNYYDNILELQEYGLRGPMETIYACMFQSELNQPLPDDFDFNFKSLWQMSDTEKSSVASQDATTMTGLYDAGIITRACALKELKQHSASTGRFSNITSEDITEAENEPPPVLESDEPEKVNVEA